MILFMPLLSLGVKLSTQICFLTLRNRVQMVALEKLLIYLMQIAVINKWNNNYKRK